MIEKNKDKDKDIFQKNAINGIKDSALIFYSWFRKRFSLNSVLKSTISYGESILEPLPISKLGRPLKDLLDIDKEFQEFKKEYEEGEKGIIEKYKKEIEEKFTSASETDYLSAILKEKVFQQKGEGKKSVLVLDDLDRIDPDHIFRILNILSAYFEKEKENKFGFNLIIIVADYANIKSIFHHKYGVKTDFRGYLDKFFTIRPFEFDNKKAVINMAETIAKNIKNGKPELNNAIGDRGYIKLFLEHIFIRAIDNDLINLRELLKATRFELTELKKYNSHITIFNEAINIAIKIFSGTNNFIEKIETIKKNKIKERDGMPYLKYVFPMLQTFDKQMPTAQNMPLEWGSYSIDHNFQVLFNGKKIDNARERLFYDVLIEYIKAEKHINHAN